VPVESSVFSAAMRRNVLFEGKAGPLGFNALFVDDTPKPIVLSCVEVPIL
jgi:hypothetical protein